MRTHRDYMKLSESLAHLSKGQFRSMIMEPTRVHYEYTILWKTWQVTLANPPYIIYIMQKGYFFFWSFYLVSLVNL